MGIAVRHFVMCLSVLSVCVFTWKWVSYKTIFVFSAAKNLFRKSEYLVHRSCMVTVLFSEQPRRGRWIELFSTADDCARRMAS